MKLKQLTFAFNDQGGKMRSNVLSLTIAALAVAAGGCEANSSDADATITAESSAIGIVNGSFETGNFQGWTTSGPATNVGDINPPLPGRGFFGAEIGTEDGSNGISSIEQTFTVPPDRSTLSFLYLMQCDGSLPEDWFTVTLTDTATRQVDTVVKKVCDFFTWKTGSTHVQPNHRYTLKFSLRDTNDGVNLEATVAAIDLVELH